MANVLLIHSSLLPFLFLFSHKVSSINSLLFSLLCFTAALGFATTIIPRWFTYYASTLLFAIFGLRMLRDGWYMSPDEGQEELEEVQADLKKRDEEVSL